MRQRPGRSARSNVESLKSGRPGIRASAETRPASVHRSAHRKAGIKPRACFVGRLRIAISFEQSYLVLDASEGGIDRFETPTHGAWQLGTQRVTRVAMLPPLLVCPLQYVGSAFARRSSPESRGMIRKRGRDDLPRMGPIVAPDLVRDVAGCMTKMKRESRRPGHPLTGSSKPISSMRLAPMLTFTGFHLES
jgi:hypothetical protein